MDKNYCGELLCYDVQESLLHFYSVLTEEVNFVKDNKNYFDNLFNSAFKNFENLIQTYKSIESGYEENEDFIDKFYQESSLMNTMIKIEDEAKEFDKTNSKTIKPVLNMLGTKIDSMIKKTCIEIKKFIDNLE